MLTYTAMDSEGTALACGIGRNVGAADSGCNPQAISGPPVGVVVVAGDSSALSEFQLWRTDISTMDMLTLRANHYCAPGASTRAATTLGGTILSMFPESQAAEFAASLLSATAETKPLEGNILDRTLADDVAGHLRALGIDVVIPDNYMPYSLTAIDAPFPVSNEVRCAHQSARMRCSEGKCRCDAGRRTWRSRDRRSRRACGGRQARNYRGNRQLPEIAHRARCL
jgi:hypothetical protein